MRSAPAPERKVPKELLQKRLEAARKVYVQNQLRMRAGNGSPKELFGWSRRILEAELPLCVNEAARVAAYRANVERTREVERILNRAVQTGIARVADAAAATYYRVEAEILLFKTTGKYTPEKEENGRSDKGTRILLTPKEEGDTLPKPPKEEKK
jgi:hypothetical protein